MQRQSISPLRHGSVIQLSRGADTSKLICGHWLSETTYICSVCGGNAIGELSLFLFCPLNCLRFNKMFSLSTEWTVVGGEPLPLLGSFLSLWARQPARSEGGRTRCQSGRSYILRPRSLAHHPSNPLSYQSFRPSAYQLPRPCCLPARPPSCLAARAAVLFNHQPSSHSATDLSNFPSISPRPLCNSTLSPTLLLFRPLS